jgi:hypothetical protein
MRKIVAGLSLVGLAVPAHADIFVASASSGSSTALVAGVLAAAAAAVIYRKRAS